MFSRNDKTFDSTAADKTAMRDKAESSAPVEGKRSVASAQPSSDIATSHTPTASVISKSLKITGQLESTEDIQIEGVVDGDVRGRHVKVGAAAKIKGTVYGDEVELAGTVEGKIEAKRVVLANTAHMSGDVVHQEIRIELGAFMDGYCRPEFGKTAASKNIQQAAKSAGVPREPSVADKAHAVASRM